MKGTTMKNILLFALALVPSLEASAFDALLTDDTSLRLDRRSQYYGASAVLPVATNYYALFKFDLDSLPPGTTADRISMASFTVFVDRVTRPGSLSLYTIGGDWSEDVVPAVTFTAQPSIPNATVPAKGRNTFVRFDVTGLVRSWLSGTNYGIAVGGVPGSGVLLALDSKENIAGGHCAKLDIEFANAAPPGSVIAYMGTNAPLGWLLCDGSAVSRANYPALWAAIGTSCGAGDSSTTFNLPDLRGVFLRGVNGLRSDSFADPDANTQRTSIFTGGNTGNAVGSYQGDEFASHSHAQYVTANSGSGTGIRQDWAGDIPALGAYPQGINTGGAGGNETRPKNAYVNYIIKY
jgi:microcystin-dependent protein